MPQPQRSAHIDDHEEHAHDAGADGQKLSEYDHLFDGLPVIDVGRDNQHDGGCRHADKKSEVPYVKSSGYRISHVGDNQSILELMEVTCPAPNNECEQKGQPEIIPFTPSDDDLKAFF